MSKIFKGDFDETGNFRANSIKKEFFFIIPRVPDYYIARAYPDLSFKLTASENSCDLSGKAYVDRMIGDPFNGKSKDRNSYLENREELKRIRLNFLDDLIASC